MHEKKVMIVIIMVIVMVYQLLGEIKARGKLLIDSASGKKYYNAVITIKRAEVLIECEKKYSSPSMNLMPPNRQKLR
jgi:hypothetical protein